MKQNLTVVGVVVALVLSGYAVLATPDVSSGVSAGEVQQALSNFARSVDQKLGASAGPEFTDDVFLNGGATYGQGCFATTTSGTLTAGDLKNNSCLVASAAGAGQAVIAWTLPASTTLGAIIPKAGNCRDWVIDTNALVAATTTTITAGTGIDVVGIDTNADVIAGDEFAKLTLCRQSGENITAYVDEYVHAD